MERADMVGSLDTHILRGPRFLGEKILPLQKKRMERERVL